MTLCALALSVAGATLAYLTSVQQGLLAAPLRAAFRPAAAAALAGGLAAWLQAAGSGAGIAATLVSWMLVWVALPYLAWWRKAAATARMSGR